MNLKWVARITGNILDELLHNSIQSGKLEIVCLMHLSIICAFSITSSNWLFTVWLTTDTFFSPCLAAGLSWDSFANKWWETAVLPHIVVFLLLHWQTLPVVLFRFFSALTKCSWWLSSLPPSPCYPGTLWQRIVESLEHQAGSSECSTLLWKSRSLIFISLGFHIYLLFSPLISSQIQ